MKTRSLVALVLIAALPWAVAEDYPNNTPSDDIVVAVTAGPCSGNATAVAGIGVAGGGQASLGSLDLRMFLGFPRSLRALSPAHILLNAERPSPELFTPAALHYVLEPRLLSIQTGGQGHPGQVMLLNREGKATEFACDNNGMGWPQGVWKG